MSYEVDSHCDLCDEHDCTFSTKIINGHTKRHRIATCPKCGDFVIGFCQGC